jgi:TonB family protein
MPKPSVTVAPRPAPAPVTAKRPALNIHDALKGVELPPNAPALGDLAPAPRAAAKPAQDLRTMLNALNVPEAASVPAPSQAEPIRESPAKPVLDPDLLRQLETLQQPVPAAAAKAPVVASKVAPARTVRPVLTQDGGPGSDHYLSRVQREISGKWAPVKIEASDTLMQVTLRFRLSRDGKVTGLAVEESSGNGYYDDSAKRAVLSSSLPPFPHEMPVQYLDVHFSFTVGEQAG